MPAPGGTCRGPPAGIVVGACGGRMKRKARAGIGSGGGKYGLSARAQPGGQPSHEDSAVAACGSQSLPGGALRIVAVCCFDAAHEPNTSDDDAGYAAVLRGDVRRDPPRFVARMSLVRDERHDRMDKKNDHSRKHGQRDSFMDASAAKDCDAFHSFPPSRRQCESRRAVTLHCFGERGVKGCAAGSVSLATLIAIRRASLCSAPCVHATCRSSIELAAPLAHGDR